MIAFRSLSFRPLRALPLALFLIPVLPAAGQGQAPAPTSASDPVLTVARVREEKVWRTVELQPFRPVAALQAALPSLPPVNAQIVQTLLAYPRDGQHTYYWPRSGDGVSYDGSTTDIYLGGLQVMRGEPKRRTFCCGLTLEVFYRVLARQARVPEGLGDAKGAARFKSLWFCRAINAPGPEEALTAFGLGRKVSPAEALPGDFVQLWRAGKTGHSVIFVGWARDLKGQVVGLHYWSTQESTKGIGFTTELFGQVDKGVRADLLSISRLLPPQEWKKPAPAPR